MRKKYVNIDGQLEDTMFLKLELLLRNKNN